MPESFQYTPLPPRSIRILSPNLPSAETEPLTWSIRIVPLPELGARSETPFEALSYTWGSASTTYPLILDGHELRIHHNLHLALPYLAHRPSSLPLWIDAVCINQSDDEEKMEQIRLMCDVYRGASKVWIWLGQAEEAASREAIEVILARIDEMSDAVNAREKAIRFPPSKFGLPSLRSRSWEVVEQIVGGPWFRRLWIVQEAALAREISVMFGPHILEWDDLENMVYKARELREIQDEDGYRLPVIDSVNINNRVFWARKLYQDWVTRGSEAYQPANKVVEDVQFYTTDSICFDPRDRVFALLGLMGDHPFVSKSNGSIPIPELYSEFVHVMTHRGEDHPWILPLDVFIHATEDRKGNDFPTWCPDFHNTYEPKTWEDFRPIQLHHNKETWKPTTRLAKSQRGKTWRELILRGTIVDTVEQVNKPFGPFTGLALHCNFDFRTAPIRDALYQYTMLYEWTSEAFTLAKFNMDNCTQRDRQDLTPDYKFTDEDLLYVLTGGNKSIHKFQHEPTLDSYYALKSNTAQIEAMLQEVGRETFIHEGELRDAGVSFQSQFTEAEKDQIKKTLPLIESLGDASKPSAAGLAYQKTVFIQYRRRLFSTRGCRMGVASGRRATQPGDLVCVFYGSQLPHIIRPQKRGNRDVYELIGECVVNGVKQELIEDWGIEAQDITLV